MIHVVCAISLRGSPEQRLQHGGLQLACLLQHARRGQVCGVPGVPPGTEPRALLVQEAEAAEQASPPMVATCHAIVKAVIGIGVEEEDRKRTWKADAEVRAPPVALPRQMKMKAGCSCCFLEKQQLLLAGHCTCLGGGQVQSAVHGVPDPLACLSARLGAVDEVVAGNVRREEGTAGRLQPLQPQKTRAVHAQCDTGSEPSMQCLRRSA